MLEMLLEALAELLGLDIPKQENRRPQAGGSRTSARRATASRRSGGTNPPQPATLGDMFRSMLGDTREGDATASAAPSPATARPRRQGQRQSARGREKPARPQTAMHALESWTKPAEPANPVMEGSLPVAEAPGNSPAPSRRSEDYGARLRNNPSAAREAFIYAEIFGPPLADR